MEVLIDLNLTNMKKGKIKRKKEEVGGRSWVDKAISKNKEKSEKVIEEYMEWMKPGTWIITPGFDRCSIKSTKYQLKEDDFPLHMENCCFGWHIFSKDKMKSLYSGYEKAKPDPTVRKKFTEWLKSY